MYVDEAVIDVIEVQDGEEVEGSPEIPRLCCTYFLVSRNCDFNDDRYPQRRPNVYHSLPSQSLSPAFFVKIPSRRGPRHMEWIWYWAAHKVQRPI